MNCRAELGQPNERNDAQEELEQRRPKSKSSMKRIINFHSENPMLQILSPPSGADPIVNLNIGDENTEDI